jgi:predicted RNase H-like nuclease (RuvC/YqgF family)
MGNRISAAECQELKKEQALQRQTIKDLQSTVESLRTELFELRRKTERMGDATTQAGWSSGTVRSRPTLHQHHQHHHNHAPPTHHTAAIANNTTVSSSSIL